MYVVAVLEGSGIVPAQVWRPSPLRMLHLRSQCAVLCIPRSPRSHPMSHSMQSGVGSISFETFARESKTAKGSSPGPHPHGTETSVEGIRPCHRQSPISSACSRTSEPDEGAAQLCTPESERHTPFTRPWHTPPGNNGPTGGPGTTGPPPREAFV